MSFTRFKALPMLCVGVVCMALAGCVKENNGMRFSIFTEPYNSAAKVAVDGLESTWQAGDRIWVNGAEAAVSLDGSGNPVLVLDSSVSSWEGVFYASYPASVVADYTQGGVLSVALPQAYQYHEDAVSGKQLLEMPMVAATRNDQLTFKHLTGVLLVRVPNANKNITLDYIMVSSSTSALSGSGTVVLSAASPQVTFGADTSHTVVMYFNDSPVTIPSTATATKDIMIPIAPTAGEHHRFTVTVCAHSTGSPRYYYLFNQESSEGNLARNEVAVAPVPGPLSSTGPFLGSGTDADPYLIQNKEDYKRFLYYVDQQNGLQSASYWMTKDVDFLGETVKSATHWFQGHFDGGNNSIRNVVMTPNTSGYGEPNLLSVFPPVTAGEVSNLNVDKVNLDCSTTYTSRHIYAGGLISYVKRTNDDVSFKNITVSNMRSTTRYSFSTGSNGSKICIGGIVGRMELVSDNYNGGIMMSNCGFSQQEGALCNIDINSCYSFSFGGLVGVVNGVSVSFQNCVVDYGGTNDSPGVNLLSGSNLSYVGALFGMLYSSTLTYTTQSFIARGNLSYTGSSVSNVNRYVGYNGLSTTVSNVDGSRLVFKRNGILI